MRCTLSVFADTRLRHDRGPIVAATGRDETMDNSSFKLRAKRWGGTFGWGQGAGGELTSNHNWSFGLTLHTSTSGVQCGEKKKCWSRLEAGSVVSNIMSLHTIVKWSLPKQKEKNGHTLQVWKFLLVVFQKMPWPLNCELWVWLPLTMEVSYSRVW